MEQEMVKIAVAIISFTEKDKSDIKLRPFSTLWSNTRIKSDERFHSIGIAISNMEFSECIEIALGIFSSRPLFIKVRRMGNLIFAKPYNEEKEGFLMFGGDEKILRGKTTAEIREEFLVQFHIFLRILRASEFTKGVEYKRLSQVYFARADKIDKKSHLIL